jgi:hypothetical protein
MDQSLPRTILGVVAGVIAGGVIVFATEAVGHSLFPPPPAINLADPEDVKRLMASLPAGAFAFVLAGWFLGSFAGAFVARLVAGRDSAAWAVAVLFILFTSMNFVMIPHPMWMIAAGILIPLASAWLALRLSGARERA